MESHALHFLPNTLFNNSHRCVHNKSWYSKCFPLPFRVAAKKHSFLKYIPARHVLLTMHNESWNHRMHNRESNAQFRATCFGSESSQNIRGNCSELNVEIVEKSDVDIKVFKENVSNGNVGNATQEDEIDNLSERASNGKIKEITVDGMKFMNTSQSVWQQMKNVIMFAGPALGIWLCSPLLSLIDTAVIGQSSSLELAALGPGTVVCDYSSYVFMFLSIATSNMVATSLAQKDEFAMQQQLSRLLFVALACGIGMLLLTKAFGTQVLHAFVGSKNASLVPAASTYVQIRGLAWPAVLVSMVAQSASLGMKDSWGPLKVLSVTTFIKGLGDIILCSFMGYGIAGAAWATTVSQFVAVIMMLQSVDKKGYNTFALSVPSSENFIQIIQIAAPVFITMISKVAFYSLITYFATSMGPEKLAAHQVMIGVYCMCTVWGEPLSQTAQAFMPALVHGMNRNLKKARSLVKSLLICGAVTGFTLECMGTAVSMFFPRIFTSDAAVISQMHQVILPFFVGLIVAPPTHSLEGSLLAGRDFKFLSYTMSLNFCVCSLLLLIINNKGLGLQSCWWTLACFQWARFSVAYKRLTSFSGPLYDPVKIRNVHQKLKAI